MATTTLTATFKQELMESGHNTIVTQSSVTVTNTSGQATLTGISSTAGIVVGMPISGSNVQANTVVAAINSLTQITMSQVSSGGAVTSVTFAGDSFKLCLIKASPSGTYDSTLANAGTPNNSSGGTPSTTNIGTDEIQASGTYSAGGVALTNVSPILSGGTPQVACGSFSVAPITGATITTIACVIYNTSTRIGASTYSLSYNRTVSVHDFGGSQTVTAGQLTLTIPTQNSTNALLRLN
jgi:hypothetical protein